MCDDVLSDIVPELVGNEHCRTSMELLEYGDLIVRLAILQDSLDHSAAIRMGCENMNLTAECFDDELDVLRRHTLDGFLYNVVAILILHALEDICLKFLDEFGLLISKDMLKGLDKVSRSLMCYTEDSYFLDNSAAIHLHRQLHNVVLHLLSQNPLLHLIAVLEHLLDHIVAENIRHQLQGVGLDLAEDLLFLITVSSFEFLLDES